MPENFAVYDSWDLRLPKVRPRSRLYPLEPMGIGTPRCESITSYVARLASEHCTSVGSLFEQRLGPASKKPYLNSTASNRGIWRSFVPTAHALNGLGATARDWVDVLETLTQQRSLNCLTMLKWRNVLSEKSLSRTLHAWCPRCYQEQKDSGSTVYDYLLWSLATVEVCPWHRNRLETKCPQCHRQFRPLDNRSRPGYCYRCEASLSDSAEHEKRGSQLSLQPDEMTYKLWVANQMEGLIAATPALIADPPINKVTDFVPACIGDLTKGNVCAFARLVGVNKMTVHSWCYTRAVPRLDLILKVCYRLGASFSDLLTKEAVSLNHELVNQSLNRLTGTRLMRSHKDGEIRQALMAALKQDPPPSVPEFAKSLGYKNPDFLYAKYSTLCKKLTARYYKSRSSRERTQPPNRLLVDNRTIELALQRAATESPPPSLQAIGRRLGYESRSRSVKEFKRKFPELSRLVLERRATERAKHQNDLKLKLESILLEQPPPTLSSVKGRLGSNTTSNLLDHYPELCRMIVIRHAQYRKAQFNSVPNKLKVILSQEPPVSLRTAAKQLGRNPAYLGSRFPQECQAISKRYALFKRKLGMEKKQEAAKRLRALAFDLDSQGIYPSLKRIKAVFGTSLGVDNSEGSAILRDLRSQFKSLRGG
jgi:hypothetical protein